MHVLAIETSCDETAAAVVEGAGRRRESGVGNVAVRVLSSVVASQADLHARTAGVVPEVAARAHVEAITFVIDDALRAAGLAPTSHQLPAPSFLDAVAAATEPGLRPALVVGETAARALALAWEKPFLPVNHLAGHIAAAWLVSRGQGALGLGHGDGLPNQPVVEHRFPAVALVVSGGHTQLWKLEERRRKQEERAGLFALRLLGQTRDDAAGEAFDKIARLLGLPYPGGAALATLAERGDACEFSFPRPMADSGDLDFSFSGLKTAVYYALREIKEQSEKLKADVAASAQEAIVDVLVRKTVQAAAQEDAAEVILTGGVAANARLRTRLSEALGSRPLVVPHPQYCTDNAAMIGAAAVLGLTIPNASPGTPGR